MKQSFSECLGMVDAPTVKMICAAATTAFLNAFGASTLLYEAVFVAWGVSFILGIAVDLKQGKHPSGRSITAGLILLVYFGLILGTHQLVRIYPAFKYLEELTAAYAAANEVLRVHGYAKFLGLKFASRLTEALDKHLINKLDGGKN